MINDSYIVNKKFDTRVERSPRVLEVAEAFGLGLSDKEFVVFENLELSVPQGSVVYITGQSGSGKSLLLRELESQMTERGMIVANLDQMELQDKPLIDQIGKSMTEGLKYLSIAGLNDAYLYIRKPQELSDGQRYRFKLAKAIESGASVWVADEFLAVLDRVAARVISFTLQKAARAQGVTLIVATTHTDMVRDLYPSIYIEKRYREKLLVEKAEEVMAHIEKIKEQQNAKDEDIEEVLEAFHAAGASLTYENLMEALLKVI